MNLIVTSLPVGWEPKSCGISKIETVADFDELDVLFDEKYPREYDYEVEIL